MDLLDPKSCWPQNFLDPNFVGHKNFLDPRFYWTKNDFYPKIVFWLKCVFDPKYFRTKIFFLPNIYLVPKIFWTQNLLENRVWFWRWPSMLVCFLFTYQNTKLYKDILWHSFNSLIPRQDALSELMLSTGKEGQKNLLHKTPNYWQFLRFHYSIP